MTSPWEGAGRTLAGYAQWRKEQEQKSPLRRQRERAEQRLAEMDLGELMREAAAMTKRMERP